MLGNEKIGDIEISKLKKDAESLKSGFGAVSWAVLEMFKRAGMPKAEVEQIHAKMNEYFPKPSNDECNAILKVVESRLQEDKEASSKLWYS
ncbi:MAG: hypothetical protein AB7H97_15010 [Pseudobdellovibrionaceae bacterium]